jgi:hypothetical protein
MPRFMKVFIGGIIFVYLGGMCALFYGVRAQKRDQDKQEQKQKVEENLRMRCAAQLLRLELVQSNTRLRTELPQSHLEQERAAVRGIVVTCSRVVKKDLDGLKEADARIREDYGEP